MVNGVLNIQANGPFVPSYRHKVTCKTPSKQETGMSNNPLRLIWIASILEHLIVIPVAIFFALNNSSPANWSTLHSLLTLFIAANLIAWVKLRSNIIESQPAGRRQTDINNRTSNSSTNKSGKFILCLVSSNNILIIGAVVTYDTALIQLGSIFFTLSFLSQLANSQLIDRSGPPNREEKQ